MDGITYQLSFSKSPYKMGYCLHAGKNNAVPANIK